MSNSHVLHPLGPTELAQRSGAGGALHLADQPAGGKSGLISHVVLRGLVRLSDFLLMAISGLLIGHIYLSQTGGPTTPLYLAIIGSTSLVAVAVFEVLGLYSSRAFPSSARQLPVLVLGWTATFGLLAAMVFFLKLGPDLSRAWLALWFAAGALLLAVERLVLARLVRHWALTGQLYRRAVIYGAGQITSELIEQLESSAAGDIRITGIFDERSGDRVTESIRGYPRLGDLNDLIALSRDVRIDLVIVALPVAGEERLMNVAGRISVLPADIKLPARAMQVRLSPRIYSHVGSVAMIDLYDKPIADWGLVSKWLFDKAIGLLALALFAPVMAAVAVAIKLDSRGPILFRQRRYGFNNELIEVLKFRSMHTKVCDAEATTLVTRDDARVTRVGRFIRKTSLDELPQLFNVLKGELSLVGPRPHALAAKAANRRYDEVVDGYFARHKVKPGITGLAQIHGWRGETDTPEKIQKRVAYDLRYIENWSLMLDLYILLLTPLSILRAKNAY